MQLKWIPGSLLALCLLLSACEDPSNVGIGLVDDQGGAPFFVELTATTAQTDTVRDVTGRTIRMLAGAVSDPLVGTIAATGYADFNSNSTSDFRGGTVASATLLLKPDYVYGDTLGDVTLVLRAMPEDWPSDGVASDTSFAAGDEVTRFTFSAADTLVEVALPPDWVAANDTTLRSSTFLTSFHGFQFEAAAGNAVVGFRPQQSLLRAITESQDTSTFPISEAVTGIMRDAATANLPPETILVQDGVGLTARFMFDFDVDSLLFSPLNRAIIRVANADDLLQQNLPANFARPRLDSLELVGVNTDGVTQTFALARAGDDGTFAFRDNSLRGLIQSHLFEEPLVDHFRLGFVPSDNTISVLLLRVPGSEAGDRPRAELALTPTDN